MANQPTVWGFGPTGHMDSSKAKTVHASNWSQSGKPQNAEEVQQALQGAKVKPLITAAALLKTMGRADLANELINVVAAELADDDASAQATNSGGLRLDL